MHIEYKQDPEIDEQILQEELSEPIEEVETDDFFEEEDQDGEDFFGEDTAPVEFDITSVNAMVTSFASMIAGMFSVLTDQPAKRYMPSAEQRRNLAKAIIKAFPQMQMKPGTALLISFLMTYAPITITAVNDYKQKKRNETASIDNNSRGKWNGQDDLSTQTY